MCAHPRKSSITAPLQPRLRPNVLLDLHLCPSDRIAPEDRDSGTRK
jgi:hypothetical protein